MDFLVKQLQDGVSLEALFGAFERTDIYSFVYRPKERVAEYSPKTCKKFDLPSVWENAPESVAVIIHPADRDLFLDMCRAVVDGEEGATRIVRGIGLNKCFKVTMNVLKRAEDGSVDTVLGLVEDISTAYRSERAASEMQLMLGVLSGEEQDAEGALNRIATALGSTYYAIYHIWMKSLTYTCFQEQLPGILSAIGERGDCVSAWKIYIEKYIEAEDRAAMYEFADFDTLGERLRYERSVTQHYRRIGVGWTRGQFVVAQRDEDGFPSHVIYTVSDINLEKERSVREEHIMFEANHDALTGVLNRKAFDDALAAPSLQASPTGFLLIDVDNFKSFNDERGHEAGDAVLIAVAEQLSLAFRSGDSVFRIGGDEFGVLLRNCTEASWNALCRKLHSVHVGLNEVALPGMDVTLSGGLCFSEVGLEPWMYAVSDEGLYNTKKHGRAGCTMVDREGAVCEYWRDGAISVRAQAALAGGNAGLCRIEIPDGNSEKGRMICGEALSVMYAIPESATPEEAFAYWRSRVEPADIEVLAEAERKMLACANVECTFTWNHPDEGPVPVRVAGAGEVVDGVITLYGLHRSLKGSVVVAKEDESKLLADALSDVYLSSFYVDLVDDSFDSLRVTEDAGALFAEDMSASTAVSRFIENLVHPDYRAAMMEFVDQHTLSARLQGEAHIDCEYLSLTDKGWCRASWFPVKRDEAGNLTHAFFAVASIELAKQKEIEKDQQTARLMSLHYEAAETVLDSHILAIALVDKQTGEANGWNGVTHFSQAETFDYQRIVDASIPFVLQNDLEGFRLGLSLENVVAEVERNGSFVYPAELHSEDGKTWYLDYHFAPYANDEDKLVGVIEDVTKIHVGEGRSLEDLYDNVPGGLITYEWDGSSLKVLHISKYYDELYGDSIAHDEAGVRSPDFERVHPDDRAAYRAAIMKALTETHELHYVYRVWNERRGRYIWAKLDAVSHDMPNGHSFVYAMYSDITEQVDVEKRLEKSYDDRVDSLVRANEDAMFVACFNLSTDEVVAITIGDDDCRKFAEARTYTDLFDGAIAGFSIGSERDSFAAKFSKVNLIEVAKRGEKRLRAEYLYRLSSVRTEWVEVSVELMTNPSTGDVECVCYAKSVNLSRFAQLVIHRALRSDYPMAAVLLGEGAEYYLFDADIEEIATHHVDFWSDAREQMLLICADGSIETVEHAVDKEFVLAELREGREPAFSFDVVYKQTSLRAVMRYSMLDEERGLVLASLRNITDDDMLLKLRHDARHDALTNLYNRKTVFEKCRALLDEHPEETFSMLHLNVRRFRLYNQFFGEEAGDKLLCTIAQGVRSLCEEYDYSAYGHMEGDVFCAFYPARADMFERHMEYLKQEFAGYCDNFLLVPAVGVYMVDDPTLPIESMFARATTAAKGGEKSSSGIVGFYDESLARKLDDEMLIAGEMQSALESGQFVPYLQPKFDLDTGECVGAEALARWIHPEWGLVSPGRFIPVFEKNGFIAHLDRNLWEQVCRLLRSWLDAGEAVAPVSVNVSRVSAYDPTTPSFLKELVTRYGIEPRLLELELTETAYMDDPKELKAQLKELQDFGFHILMDDFGSGYSSLNTLRELPVDCLKLDMRFLSESCDDERGRTVLSSIVGMTKRLGLPVVAEGVETEPQAAYLRSLGCDYVQGFLFARPMTAQDYESLSCGA